MVAQEMVERFWKGIDELRDEAELLARYALLLVITVEGAGRHRDVVGGEDIDKDALVETVDATGFATGPAGGGRVAELGMTVRVVGVGGDALEEVGVLELVGMGEQLVIVLAEHNHVDVVVPGDEALVTHGAEEGTTVGIDAEVVFPAHTEQFLEQVQLDGPDSFHLGRHGIVAHRDLLPKGFRYGIFQIHKEDVLSGEVSPQSGRGVSAQRFLQHKDNKKIRDIDPECQFFCSLGDLGSHSALFQPNTLIFAQKTVYLQRYFHLLLAA